jgi:hypothetical protein
MIIVVLVLILSALGSAWSAARYAVAANSASSFSDVTALAQAKARGPPAI